MKKSLLGKILVIGIIILFVGASVISGLQNNSYSKQDTNNITSTFNNLDLNDGLVGYRSFDFRTAEDESNNDNDGTVHDAATVDGISGKAFDFDGINDYIAVHDDPSLEFGYNDFTISFWIKCTNILLKIQPISKDRGLDGYRSWRVLINTQSEVIFVTSDNGHNEDGHQIFGGTVDANLQNNIWYHIVIVKDGTDAIFYVNGSVMNDDDTIYHSKIHDSSAKLHIGCRLGWEGYPIEHFPGVIDEVRIYNRVLSEDEIQELYINPARLETTILIGTIYNFNADAGNLMTFEALKLKSIKFNPFRFKKLDAGEKIKISEKFPWAVNSDFCLWSL